MGEVMTKLSRKFKRKKNKKDKKAAQKELQKTLASFHMRPDNCSLCEAPFNKQSKKDHLTWQVAVFSEKVLLFCPNCIKEKIKEHENK